MAYGRVVEGESGRLRGGSWKHGNLWKVNPEVGLDRLGEFQRGGYGVRRGENDLKLIDKK